MPFLVVGLIVLCTVWYWNYTQDDVFITYTYSRNIATGQGFVFNEGERVLGTTTPLWALLMAGVYRLTPDLLHAGNFISALGTLAVCALSFWLASRLEGFWLGAGAAVLLAANPIFYIAFGMESMLYAALLMAAFALALAEREVASAVCLGLLTLVRADGVLAAGALGLTALIHSRRIAWRGLLAYGLVITPWFVFAMLYFGSPFPQTLNAKADVLGGLTFLLDGWLFWGDLYWKRGPVFWLAVPLIGVALVYAVRSKRAWLPLFGWAALYALGYTVLNVAAFWYYVPLIPMLTLAAGLGGLVIWRRIRDFAPGWAWIAPLLIVGWALGSSLWSAYAFRNAPRRVDTYALVGQWLNAHTPPDATAALGDLGVVGYYAQRKMIDSPALIVPDHYGDTLAYTILKYAPDYVITTQYFLWQQTVVNESWFTQRYAPVVALSTPRDSFSPMVVYQRVGSLAPLGDTTYPFGEYVLRAGLPETAVAGDRLPVRLELTAPPGVSTQVAIGLCVLARESEAVVLEQVQPLMEGRYPAPQTLGPERLTEFIPVPLAVWLEPGDYLVRVSQAPLAPAAPVPDCSAEATHTLGTVRVLPPDQMLGYVPLEQADFGGVARLQGAGLVEDVYWSGGSLPLTLIWEALAPDDVNYSVYVHLVDSEGRLWAQNDGYPREGTSPTTSWQPGERVVDPRRVVLPPNLPEGEYRLQVGLYNWETLERVLLPDGDDGLIAPFSVQVKWPAGSGLPDN